MGTLVFNSNALDKYFGILKHLDIESKKKLIQKLTASIRRDHRLELSMDDLFGAWKDSRNADEIIHYIEDSRVNNTEIEPLA